MKMNKVVLLVEDNSDDVYLLRESLRLHSLSVTLKIFEDGEQAIEWIREHDSAAAAVFPAAVILDLNLPKRKGAEVLAALRQSSSLGQTPVIIFSSSNNARDRALQEQYHSTRYVRKSSDFDEFTDIGRVLKEVIQMDAATH